MQLKFNDMVKSKEKLKLNMIFGYVYIVTIIGAWVVTTFLFRNNPFLHILFGVLFSGYMILILSNRKHINLIDDYVVLTALKSIEKQEIVPKKQYVCNKSLGVTRSKLNNMMNIALYDIQETKDAFILTEKGKTVENKQE